MGEPDYEDPGDANGDNLYELTVIATRHSAMTSSLAVTVKVTNDPTDDNVNTPATYFEIFNRQPEVNTLLTVEGNPTDPDGNVRSVRWQWYWQTADGCFTAWKAATCPNSCHCFNPADPTGTGDPDLNATSSWMKIVGATSSSYRPTLDRVDNYRDDPTTTPPDDREDAGDAFDCLMVRASYLDDGPRSADDSSTGGYDESRQYAYAISEFSVQADEDTDNVEPEFRDGYTAVTDVQVRPKILENFPDEPAELTTQTMIFSPVEACTCDGNPMQYSTPGEFIEARPI